MNPDSGKLHNVILPSGRPGVVLIGVPEKLGRKLILLANSFSRMTMQ